MEDLAKFVEEINKSTDHYDMKEFQSIRKQINSRAHGRRIFPIKLKHKNYIYHFGGRAEIQFNIGEWGSDKWRYGIAFALKRDRYLHDPLKILEPKIYRFIQYLKANKEKFEDMKFWAYDESNNQTITGPREVKPIRKNNKLIRNEVFLFWGKFESRDTVTAHDVLSLFDRMLPLYEYVENGRTNGEDLERKKYGSRGEGNAHKLLKEWCANNPQFLGLGNNTQSGKTEYRFICGDQVDIMFDRGENLYAVVEIETYDPLPGAHQSLKYRTLMCSEKGLPLDSENVLPILIAWSISPEVRRFCNKYSIKCFEKKI